MKSFLLSVFILLAQFASSQIKLKSSAPLMDKFFPSTQESPSSLKDIKKKNGLIVIFSCNTCPFVVGTEDFPGWENQYNPLYNMALKANIGFVLVNSNEGKRAGVDSFEEMKSHAKKMSYQMPYLMDENSELANAMEAKTTPHVFFFDKNNKLIYAGSIDNIWDNKRKKDEQYLSMAIQSVLNGKKVKPNYTAAKGCSIKRVSK
ncbi:MAG: redoxin family protein [Flavobacteriia bacterium]|nr:redoxin family protein [Flavobacteriia bacterium]